MFQVEAPTRMTNKKKSGLILVADDNEDYFRILTIAFKKIDEKIELRRVGDGEELVDYLLHREDYQNPADSPEPRLIFMDVNMPRKNGFEALQEIRSHPELRQIPIIMLSVSDNPKDVMKGYSLGANSFLMKPAGLSELLTTLQILKQYWFEQVELPPMNGSGV